MRNSLLRFFLCLAVGAAWDCRAQGPAKLPPSVPASSLIGRWTLVGTTWIKRTRKDKYTSSVATTTVRCNSCPDVHFQANGRGAFLTEGRQDTLSRFQWHVAQQVLTLRIIGPPLSAPILGLEKPLSDPSTFAMFPDISVTADQVVIAWFQKAAPALMRTGSTKRNRYAVQFFGRPGGAGFINCTALST